MYSPRSFLSLHSCPSYNFHVFFHSARRWMRRLLWRRIQRNRSPKSFARLSLSSIINSNLITTAAQRSLLTFLSQNLMIWNTSEENKTISGSCACKTRSHFPVGNSERRNWKLESVTKFRFPRPILSFPVFQFRFATSPVFQTGSWGNWKSVSSALTK